MVRSSKPHPCKLSHSLEFRACQELGKKYVFQSAIIWVKNSPFTSHRLGMIVSRRVGKSVVRNRLKRIMREKIKNISSSAPLDVVVLVRPLQKEIMVPSLSTDLGRFENKLKIC